MKRYFFLYLLLFIGLGTVSSCVDLDNATASVCVNVQLSQPIECVSETSLSGKTVVLQVGDQNISAVTDAEGKATFPSVVPDIYNISVSWNISAEEYRELTGSSEVVTGATLSSSLNSQLIKSDETITLSMLLSANRDIVVGKVYYAGSRDNNNRNYMAGKYIELYNQSDKAIDVSGLYVGIVEAESTPAYTLANLQTVYDNSVTLLKQIYRIPAVKPCIVESGGTIIICNSAIDHTTNNNNENDLLDADFEVKDVTGRFQNNPATPAMEMIYQIYNGTSVMNLLQSGPAGIVIFRTEEDVKEWPKVYAYGKSSGNQWVACPVRYIIDGMEALKNGTSGIDIKTKRLYDFIDAGYTYINATSGWNGETVYRKTVRISPDGHKILADTNNSSNDFTVSKTIKPREYE